MPGNSVFAVQLLTPISAFLSVCYTAWFIWKFGRSRGHRKRLFLQQLYILAVVDMLASLLLMVLDFMHFMAGGGHAVTDCFLYFSCPLCKALISVFRWLRFVSVLMETQIAVGIFCAWHRLFRSVAFVQRTIPFVPFLGMLLAALSFLRFSVDDAGGAVGRKNCHAWDEDNVTYWALQLCFWISVLSYGAAFLRPATRPMGVHVKALQKTWIYALIFVVTYGPVIVLSAPTLTVPDAVRDWFCIWAGTAQSLNGFLNVFTYYVQSRYHRNQLPNLSLQGNRQQLASFHVGFDPTGVDEECYESHTQTSLNSDVIVVTDSLTSSSLTGEPGSSLQPPLQPPADD